VQIPSGSGDVTMRVTSPTNLAILTLYTGSCGGPIVPEVLTTPPPWSRTTSQYVKVVVSPATAYNLLVRVSALSGGTSLFSLTLSNP